MTTERARLTALIPAGDEAHDIADCLASVHWADEVFVVVDERSTDGTEEIARRTGARVERHEYRNSAAQKNWAIPRASHEWILLVDADERVTPALREEVEALLERGPDRDGYAIFRRNFAFGRELRHGGWNRDTVIRLFRRDRCHYADLEVHAEIELDGEPGTLRGRLEHYTYRTIEDYFGKFDRYTTLAARDLHRRGTRAGPVNIMLRPLLTFLKMYVLRLGVLDGMAGLLICSFSSFYVHVKYAKLLEINRRSGRRSDPAR